MNATTMVRGVKVLAKSDRYPFPLHYMSRAQADAKAAKVGAVGVTQFRPGGRCFYVVMP